jgi:hypothetical protein
MEPQEYLTCDPATGRVFRVTVAEMGPVTQKRRYRGFHHDGKTFTVHRFIWEFVNGPTPDGMHIDHVNRDAHDNRIDNLRIVTPSQNAQNRAHKGGSSGYRGVSWSKQHRQWLAQIMVGRKRKFLGLFKDEQDAADAYIKAAAIYHSHNPSAKEKAPDQ